MAAKAPKLSPQPKSNDKDSPLDSANHNRGFDPSKSSERATMAQKMASDAAKYKADNGKGSSAQVSSSLNSDANRMRSEK